MPSGSCNWRLFKRLDDIFRSSSLWYINGLWLGAELTGGIARCVSKGKRAGWLWPQHHPSLPPPAPTPCFLVWKVEERAQGGGGKGRSPACSSVCLDMEHTCAVCPPAVISATSGWKALWHFLSGFQWHWGISLGEKKSLQYRIERKESKRGVGGSSAHPIPPVTQASV